MKKIFFLLLLIINMVGCNLNKQEDSLYLHSISWEKPENNPTKITLGIGGFGQFYCQDTHVFLEENGQKTLLFESIPNPIWNEQKICPENIQIWDYKIAQIEYCYRPYGDGDCETFVFHYDIENKKISPFSMGIPSRMGSQLSYSQMHGLKSYYRSEIEKRGFSDEEKNIYEAIRNYFKDKFHTDIGDINQNTHIK